MAFILSGPRQTTGLSASGRKEAMLTTLIPWDSSGTISSADDAVIGAPSRPIILAMFGPCRSVSRIPTVFP